ncbi:MAG: serine/threonine protein kinase, partial [Planctomycetaceae bacterium]|nr:serine/threonine protein kinase [Planctomycetaceae bacterium]
MGEPTIADFVKLLAESRLLTDAQLQLLRKQLVGNSVTAPQLADILVRQNHLTEWQSRQLLKGQTGFVLQHYRLLTPIGRGGMGHVFRGMDTRDSSVVAVKVMARRLKDNQTLVSRFQREIRASSRLNCPHIVRTLDAGRVGNTDFMVMEYVNGDQLDRIAGRLGRVPVRTACEIIRQCAVALQHAHDQQMVHRDIKPANVMVHWQSSGEGVVKLMDMGLVRVMSETGEEDMVTRAGQVMGTPDYMSPEQGWDTTQVDIRSDIYSLGCTLFRLLTGQVPFRGSNPLQVLSQRLQRDAPSVRTLCDDIPEEVAAVVRKMTRRDPNSRYQTPAEVTEALQPFCDKLTRQALKEAARAVDDQSVADIGDPNDSSVDEDDGSYRQFLAEMQQGSTVDLMFADQTDDRPADTFSALSFDVTTTPPRTVNPVRSSAGTDTEGRRKGVMVGVGAAGAVLLLLLMAAFRGGDAPVEENASVEDNTSVGGNTSVTDSGSAREVVKVPPSQAKAAFGKLQPDEAIPGQLWTVEAQYEITPNNTVVSLKLGESAPPGIRVADVRTGKLEWSVPADQTPGTYTVPIQIVAGTNSAAGAVLAETTLSVEVRSAVMTVKLPEFRPFVLEPGEPLQVSVAAEPPLPPGRKLRYRIDGIAPPGLKVDRNSGELKWTPAGITFGRFSLDVVVSADNTAEPLGRTTLAFMVVPSLVEHVLPPIEPQTATPGRPFRLKLPESPDLQDARRQFRRVVEFGPGAPPGMTIAEDEVRWDVPADASGQITVPMTARMEGLPGRRERLLSGFVTLEINIAPKTPTSPPKTGLPPDDAVAAAMKEIRSTYEKPLAQARTLPQKTQLAARLLDLACDGTSGAVDAALLQLIDSELATKSRATDILLETSRLRSERYGTD